MEKFIEFTLFYQELSQRNCDIFLCRATLEFQQLINFLAPFLLALVIRKVRQKDNPQIVNVIVRQSFFSRSKLLMQLAGWIKQTSVLTPLLYFVSLSSGLALSALFLTLLLLKFWEISSSKHFCCSSFRLINYLRVVNDASLKIPTWCHVFLFLIFV